MGIDYKTKYQACNLSDALHRNINDNFNSVSFRIENDEILIKIILNKRTKVEDEYIEDITAEFEALQEGNILSDVIVTTIDQDNNLLDIIVYQEAW